MAQAIDFPERNDYIGKPEDLSENQCYALPVARIVTYIPGQEKISEPVQVHANVSCWQLTEEETQEVAKSGKVYLRILGHTLYPTSIHGKLPIYPGTEKLSDVVLTKEEIDILKGGK
ncbi:MAG: hypothetical protein H7Y42_12340 [Chitinophagaceae bacterium]|nr:hypothetical protein [Chitinophagaceae bacterium]